MYDETEHVQYFPFKSVTMLLTFSMLLLASWAIRLAKLDHLLRHEDYELHEEESPSKEELQPSPTGFIRFFTEINNICCRNLTQ